MEDLEGRFGQPGFVGAVFPRGGKTLQIIRADNFEYTDPIDGSVSKKQVCVSFQLKLLTLVRRSRLGVNTLSSFLGIAHHLRRRLSYCSSPQWYWQFRRYYSSIRRQLRIGSGEGEHGCAGEDDFSWKVWGQSRSHRILQVLLKPLIEVALEVSKLQQYTGRDKPTVIT